MQISEGVKSAWLEIKQALPNDPTLRPLIQFALVATGLFSGVFFAVEDYGKVNVVVSFVAGSFTGPIFLVVGYSAFILGAFLSYSTVKVFRREQKRRFEPGGGSILLLMIYAGLIATGCYWLLLKLPVIGHQVGYFLRDQ